MHLSEFYFLFEKFKEVLMQPLMHAHVYATYVCRIVLHLNTVWRKRNLTYTTHPLLLLVDVSI